MLTYISQNLNELCHFNSYTSIFILLVTLFFFCRLNKHEKKVRKIKNNLKNDHAVVDSDKIHNIPNKECFVLLTEAQKATEGQLLFQIVIYYLKF